MRLFKFFLPAVLFSMSLNLSAQAPTYDEMEFEPDSVRSSYKPSGKNYVLIKSKRGNEGVNKTAQADAILTAEVSEIVLVFSETSADALQEREEANRERWENLLKTYPELFQFSTTYKNVCQCNTGGDAEAFKRSQGFYVYVNGDVPKAAEEPVASTPPPAATPAPARTEEKKAPAEEKRAPEPPPATKNVAVTDNTRVKANEPPPVVNEAPPAKKEEKKEEKPVANTTRAAEETPEPVEEVKAAPVKKKPAVSSKPRRAKDAKACRPACYGFGDEDLAAFFKENIPLTKKQRKKAKSWMANVRLQIHYDGTIKKAMITGSPEEFSKQTEEIVKNMNPWNPAVKGGVAVKSEVRFTLKFDKETKSMKPFDVMMNPRPTPKCTCKSDSEIFAD